MKKITLLSIAMMFLLMIFNKTPAVGKPLSSVQNKPADTGKTAKAAPVLIIAPVETIALPKVINVVAKKIDTVDDRQNGARKSAYAGDLIMVLLLHPKEFLDQRPTDQSKLILYAEGVELKGISSDLFKGVSKPLLQSEDTVWISFKLIRDTTTKAAWDCLYRIAHWNDTHLKIHITVGWQGMFPVKVPTKYYANTQIDVVFFEKWAFIAWLVLYAIIVVTFIALALKSNMLRDSDAGPYSLAQSQLAFWTILIMGSFIYTLILTDISSSLNSSILFLLGISITANSSAVYIDYYKKKDQTLEPKISKGFFADILGDGNTISVQRVQNAAWTLVLGLYLVYYTISNKTLPTYPDMLLYLTGISSLAYVAVKPTENKKPTDNTPPNIPPPQTDKPLQS
jgi:hypothetical protein